MGELGMHLLLKTMLSVKRRKLAAYEVEAVAAPLPLPMVDGNFQLLSDKCFIANYSVEIVTQKVGGIHL